MSIYKIEFESVLPIGRGSRFYNGEQPICAPSQVPDEYWTKSSKETDNPWDQYNTLKRWAASGEQLIRNVKLFSAITEPRWMEIEK